MTRYAATTGVSSPKSRVEIEKTLSRYGASAFMYGTRDGLAVVGFEMTQRRIRFDLPLPARSEFVLTANGYARSDDAIDKSYEQAIRQRWRALLLVIKAKLESIESGIEEFDDAFMAQIVLPGNQTVSEWLRPQLVLAYKDGKVPPLLIEHSGD